VVFAGVDITFEQTSALRHTLGAILTKYDSGSGQWQYYWDLPDTLENIDVTRMLYSPDMITMMDMFKDPEYSGGEYGRYIDILKMVTSMLDKEGFLGYLMDNMKSDYTTSQIIDDLYLFLTENYLFNENLPDYDPILWTDMGALMTGFGDILVQGNDPNAYDDFYWTKNYTPFDYQDNEGQYDAYTLFGELLSQKKSPAYLKWFEEVRK
jgi:hypothetical protein